MDLMEPWDPLDHPPRIEIRRQDSDDSDAEGGLGNVTRVVLRPPGHSGKAKRGHLSFDASFETGNLGRVDFISEFEYDLFVRPDTCNPRHRLWFNFVVDNVRMDQRVIFNIVNLSKSKTLFSNGMTPLVKTTSRPKWQRLGGKYVYYHKSPEHRNHYILSFAFVFDREDDVYQFALTFPYSYARVNLHLTFLQQKNLPWISVQTLANSLQNRKVEVYSICNPALLEKKPKAVVIMARIHPGESPTSYVAQGLIDFLMSSHPMAGVLRDHVLIKVIPMVNPDGVFMGNHRTSLMGYDLNRHWNQISPLAHPILQALKTYFQELDRDKRWDLDMILDLHAHTSLLGTFIYGNSYEDVYRFERHILFPKLLAHNAEDYNPIYTMYNRDPHKSGTARRHLCDTLKSAVNVYTLQISVYGYTHATNGNAQTIPYTEDSYFCLGRNLIRSIAEYYRVTGIIPVKTFSSAISLGPENDDVIKKKRIIRRSRSRSRPRTRKAKTVEIEDGDVAKEDPNEKPAASEQIDENSGYSSEDGDSDVSHCQMHLEEPAELEGIEILNAAELCNFGETTLRRVTDPAQKWNQTNAKLESTFQEMPAFKTFDFSVLTTEEYRRLSRMEFPVGNGKGRKVGGGGILGKQKKCKSNKMSTNGKTAGRWVLDGDEPSLTIIDFNQLIRMGLEQRLTEAHDPLQKTQIHKLTRRKSRQGQRSRALCHRTPVTTDCSGLEDSSSDSEYERQFYQSFEQASSPLESSRNRNIVQPQRMKLNPREGQPRSKVISHVQFP